MTQKKTQEEYLSILNQLGGGEYTLVDGELYQNNKHKLQTLHKTCGNVTVISPRAFVNGQRCFSCSKDERLSKNREDKHNNFLMMLQEETNGEYVIQDGEYFIASKKHINLVHQTCGNMYRVRPDDFKKGSRCPKCRDYSSIRKSHEQFLKEFSEESKGEYEVLEGQLYVNSKTAIQIIHKTCGQIYDVVPSAFLQGKARCLACKKLNKPIHNPEKFMGYIHKVREVVGDEYTVMNSSNYLNLKSSVLIRHEKCGYEYSIVASYLLKGSSCPKCLSEFRKQQKWKKKTHKEFVQELLIKGEGHYELVAGEKYVNNLIHVQMRHVICGFEYAVSPANFLKGCRCPYCSDMNRGQKTRKTHDIFVQEVRELVQDEYIVIGEYKNSKEKVRMKHAACGFEWDINPSSFLSKTRCPSCARIENIRKKRKTLDEFKMEMFKLVRDEYQVKDGEKYTNITTPLQIIHNTCGYEYFVRPGNFLNGRRCPSCSDKTRGEKTRKDLSVFKQQVSDIGNQEYELTPNSVYINTDTPIEMRHLNCGHVWKITPASFIRGNKCPNCKGGIRRTHEAFLEEVLQRGKGEYSVAKGEVYKNNHTHLRMIHNSCGTHYMTAPGNFFSNLNNGISCPNCSSVGMSKGEQELTTIFEERNVEFIPQKSFDECKYKRPLRFDFAIYQEGSLQALIEYNGPQHYHAIDYFGGESALIKTQLRDNIKRTYCKERGIPLIEIRYDEEILPKLTEELSKLSVHI